MDIRSMGHSVIPIPPGGVKIQKVDNGYLVTVSDGQNEDSEKVLVFNTMSALHAFLTRHFIPELSGNVIGNGMSIGEGDKPIDWDAIPERFNYVAVDSFDDSKEAYAYKNIPSRTTDAGGDVTWDAFGPFALDAWERMYWLDDKGLRDDVVYVRPR